MLTRTTILCFVLFCLLSCSRDQVMENVEDCPSDPITYKADIKLLLNTYCAYAGCHDGTRPSDFRTYDAMEPWLTEDQFVDRVINQRDMPPGNSTPGLTEIPEEEIMMIQCWVQQGYLEE